MGKSPAILNGQVWRQLDFPCYEIIVLMLGFRDGKLLFTRATTGRASRVPLVMTDEYGRWEYTEDELLEVLHDRNYTYIGEARITTDPDTPTPENKGGT